MHTYPHPYRGDDSAVFLNRVIFNCLKVDKIYRCMKGNYKNKDCFCSYVHAYSKSNPGLFFVNRAVLNLVPESAALCMRDIR